MEEVTKLHYVINLLLHIIQVQGVSMIDRYLLQGVHFTIGAVFIILRFRNSLALKFILMCCVGCSRS